MPLKSLLKHHLPGLPSSSRPQRHSLVPQPCILLAQYHLWTLSVNANMRKSIGRGKCWNRRRDLFDLSSTLLGKFVVHSNGLLDALNGW